MKSWWFDKLKQMKENKWLITERCKINNNVT